MPRARIKSNFTRASAGFWKIGAYCRLSCKRSPSDLVQLCAIGCPRAGANGISPMFGWSFLSLPRWTLRIQEILGRHLPRNRGPLPPEQSHEFSHKTISYFLGYRACVGFAGG